MKMNAKEILIPTVSLFTICLIVTALLALTNHITAPMIEQLSIENAAKVSREVLPAAESFTEVEGTTGSAGYTADGVLCGYVFTEEVKGYGGALSVMVGIDTTGTVTGVSVLEHNETPGLGGNVTKSEFYSQFTGLSADITATKNAANPANNEIKAVTGATISSKAVTKAVNQALQIVEDYEKSLNTEGVQ